jgi:hypothetical protein
MKKNIISILTGMLLLHAAIASDGNKPANKKRPVHGDSAIANKTTRFEFTNQTDMTRAEGMAIGSDLLQDVGVYTIAGEKRLVLAYISGMLATEVGYMGFKVGDRVTWQPMIDMGQGNKQDTCANYFTGVIDMLDRDRCYIKVDCNNRVIVKLYEDLTKLHR